ncbi:hypothetical protein ASPCADRAFT_135342 [Aspergillus carbonarius ITEM 5010]|uniref:Transcription factor domain-containing protein n=1 Tax=Aspergillus carbonarius (strain ITEM 5010) TaxID=602072 RepID=A0A1R3R6Y4_ASPC5|nr:hypothetical protein ASPCADRAFT_135342 [Aspergillus carbonarius ITEM 5010]
MAMGSEGVMGALLGLSEVCVLRGAVSGGPGVVGYEREYDGVLTSEVALMEVLWEVKDLVVDVSRGWTKRTITGGKTRVVESLVHRAFSPGIEGSVYWLFVRLGLSVALANDEPIQVQLPLCSMPDLSTLSRMESVQNKTRTYAHIILWLCGNALMVYHHQHAAPRQWLEVFEHLDQWYHLRPTEFQPMVDSTDGPGFPLLLFVNGAGILCNQLYHTAMLLLLQCKPRTALLNLQSPTLSPLWHAQRICGIAMNNDRRESWDPCLIASFLVAARRMTHEAQQTEILQGLERVGVITGWRVDEYLMQLREDWSLMGSAHV